MNFRLVRELMRKDLQDLMKNRYVFYSIFFLPLIISVISILGTVSTASSIGPNSTAGVDVLSIFSTIFILIPAIITTLIGSTSIILEKNNHNLEPLLATPITESEFLAGKSLAPFLPGVLITWLAYAIYIVVTDALTFRSIGYLLFPTPQIYIGMFFLTPVVGMLGTFASLIVSSKMKDVRAAQQVSSLVVLPILMLVYLPLFSAGSDLMIMIILGVVLLAAAIVLFVLSIKTFRRDSILIFWK